MGKVRLLPKYKKRLILGVALILLGSVLTGCTLLDNLGFFKSGTEEEKITENPPPTKRPIILSTERSQIVVFYATTDGEYLVPVTISINPTKEVAQVAVEKLLAGPNNDFLKGPIPEGTKLREIYFLEGSGTIYIDLTKSLLEMKNAKEVQLALDSLVYTLGEFPSVEQFKIFVDGQVVNELHGVSLDVAIKKENKVNFIGSKSEKDEQITVYYGDGNAMFLVPISIDGPKTDKVIDKAEAALSQLIKGTPKKGNLASPIWKGTKVINITLDEAKKLLTVNFSKEIVGYGGGSAFERLLTNSLLFTLTSLPGIEKVQILVEGQKVDYLPEGTDIYSPLVKPEKLNCSP